MEYLNKIQLRGIVGNKRTTEVSGIKTCRLQLATNSVYKSSKGDVIVETQWHEVVIYGSANMPDFNKIERGAKMEVTGRLRNMKYTGCDGTEHVTCEVIAHEVRILDKDEPMEYENH